MYKNTVFSNDIVLLLFIIPLFTPQSLSLLFGGILEKGFLLWNIMNFFILFFIFLITIKTKKKYTWSFILFWLVYLVCSISVTSDFIKTLNTWIGTAVPIINFALLGNLLIKYSHQKFVVVINKYLTFLLTLNLLLLFIFPQGVVKLQHVFIDGRIADSFKRVNFMATDNTIVQFLIITILFVEIRNYLYKDNNLQRKLVWMISGLTIIILWSGTGLIGYSVFLISATLFLFPKFKKIPLSINMVYIIGLVAFLVIVVLRLQTVFEFIIVKLLKKDISLSSRTEIWDIAYSMFLKSPFIGFGNNSKGWLIEYNWYNYYAHNLILDILLQGGVIVLIGVVLILNYSRMTLRKQPDKYLESLFACCILAIFTLNITESQFLSIYFYIPFILAWLLSTYNPKKLSI
ncbi:O-antigen ligase family protein [Priestia flexa]|uniref:O-antigen ligase family protein n=1 Tax=Priestia flexa TaxID=86664 RepID=UPI0028908870|nr:O-antigen ligase family protein [Priestia flexa]MDT2047776.1 O-antigen ligase family protein [Priestia flexa]